MTTPSIPLMPRELDDAQDADRRFFKRLPRRTHRLRSAYPVERRLFRSSPPPGMSHYIWITKLAPGSRTRVAVFLRAGIDTDELTDDAIVALTANADAFYGGIDVD